MLQRQAAVSRDTLETQISVSVNLDGTGNATFDTGLPFLEHMLDQVARHGIIDLEIIAKGDLHIDAHHTVEDIGIKTTLLRSLGGEELIFSNQDLTNSRVRNYKRMNRRRIVFKFGVIYQTTLTQLKKIPQIVEEIITQIP